MKKIIFGFIFLFLFLFSFGKVNAFLPENPCLININGQGCPGGDALQVKCTNAGGIYEWVGEDCMCTLFFDTPAQLPTQSCISVPTEEELELAMNDCEGGEILKDGSCCPSGKYVYDNNKKCCTGVIYNESKLCCEFGRTVIKDDKGKESCVSCEAISASDVSNLSPEGKQNCVGLCESSKIYKLDNGLNACCPGMVVTGDNNLPVCIINTEGDLGINMNSQCLKNGQCSYNIYETLGIRKSDQNPQVKTFVQDIILAVTMFLGTVIAIILVISGILYIIAGISGKSSMADMAKKGIINSILGLLLVTGSYALVRLVQFVATAGGG